MRYPTKQMVADRGRFVTNEAIEKMQQELAEAKAKIQELNEALKVLGDKAGPVKDNA